MLVILEGPDRVGKTTLANKLKQLFESADYECEIYKSKFRSANPAVAIIQNTLPLVLEEKIWIVDRLHLTESVYTTYYERETPYPDNALDWIDQCFSLQTKRALLVLLTASFEVLEARHAATAEPYDFDIAKVANLFVDAFEYSQMVKAWVDTSELGPDELAALVFNAVKDTIA